MKTTKISWKISRIDFLSCMYLLILPDIEVIQWIFFRHSNFFTKVKFYFVKLNFDFYNISHISRWRCYASIVLPDQSESFQKSASVSPVTAPYKLTSHNFSTWVYKFRINTSFYVEFNCNCKKKQTFIEKSVFEKKKKKIWS